MVTSLSVICRRKARNSRRFTALLANTGRSNVAGIVPGARATVLTTCPRSARASPRYTANIWAPRRSVSLMAWRILTLRGCRR